MAVRKGDEDAPWLKTLIEVYHSPEIKEYIETKYKGAVIPTAAGRSFARYTQFPARRSSDMH